jgi:hypothetical protein
LARSARPHVDCSARRFMAVTSVSQSAGPLRESCHGSRSHFPVQPVTTQGYQVTIPVRRFWRPPCVLHLPPRQTKSPLLLERASACSGLVDHLISQWPLLHCSAGTREGASRAGTWRSLAQWRLSPARICRNAWDHY